MVSNHLLRFGMLIHRDDKIIGLDFLGQLWVFTCTSRCFAHIIGEEANLFAPYAVVAQTACRQGLLALHLVSSWGSSTQPSLSRNLAGVV